MAGRAGSCVGITVNEEEIRLRLKRQSHLELRLNAVPN
jgi:hypothetical protein